MKTPHAKAAHEFTNLNRKRFVVQAPNGWITHGLLEANALNTLAALCERGSKITVCETYYVDVYEVTADNTPAFVATVRG